MVKYAVYSMSDVSVDSRAELMDVCDTREEAEREGARLEDRHTETPGYFTYIQKVEVNEYDEIIAKLCD